MRIKSLLLAIVFLIGLSADIALAQPSEQSVKEVLKQANQSLAEYDLEEASKKIAKAKKISQDANYTNLFYEASFLEGLLLQNQGNYLQSIEVFEDCIKRFKNAGPQKKLADCYGAEGVSYSKMGNYSLSFYCLNKSLAVYQSLKDSIGIAKTYSNIGAVYWSQEKLDKALEYLEKSNSIRESTNDRKGLALNLGNTAIIYSSLNRNDEAIKVFYKTIHECEVLQDVECLANSYSNLGMLIEQKGLLDSALDLQLTGVKYRKIVGDLNGLAVSYINLASVYYHQKNYKDAIENAKKGLELGEKTNSFEDVAEGAKLLSDIAEDSGDLKKALDYFKKYSEAQDSLNKQVSETKFLQAQSNFEIKQKQDAAELLRQKAEKQAITNKAQRNILLILLITSILVIFILYRVYIDNNKTTQLLQQKNLELQSLNKERDALTKIVAHDLKGPISQVKGLASLLKLSGPLNHDQIEIVEKLDGTVVNGYKLIENLLDVSLLELHEKPIDKMSCNLSKIITNCIKMHHPSATVKGIVIESNITFFDSVLSNEKALHTIIENLISNSIKFSYSGSLVKIDCYDEPDYVFVEVRDSGQGFSESDKKDVFTKYQKLSATPTGGESSTGLGLYLVKLLADSIRIEITLKSKVNLGASFLLKIPKK